MDRSKTIPTPLSNCEGKKPENMKNTEIIEMDRGSQRRNRTMRNLMISAVRENSSSGQAKPLNLVANISMTKESPEPVLIET